MIPNLKDELLTYLKSASELYVAVALMKDYGLDLIEENLQTHCVRKYLLGIDLPTTPKVLRRLLDLQKSTNGQLNARIYLGGETYHPKVYLIRNDSGVLTAFVGSANATRGGLFGNIELSIRVSEKEQCEQLLEWFNKIYARSSVYDSTYVDAYTVEYKRNKSIELTRKSNIDSLMNRNAIPAAVNVNVPSGQFFTNNHFAAFAPDTHYLTSDQVVAARASVRDRLLELHDLVWSQLKSTGFDDLHTPSRRNNYTSQHFHSRGNTHIPKDAIWLNYGKSPDELARFPEGYHRHFVNHIRMQIILRNDVQEAYIGIWLFAAKDGGSYYDRNHLKNRLGDGNYTKLLYEYVRDLGGSYWISIGDDYDLYVSDLENEKQLVDFLIEDDYSGYFIIGRNYPPTHDDMSEENICETVVSEFSKLYKIYEMIKAPALIE